MYIFEALGKKIAVWPDKVYATPNHHKPGGTLLIEYCLPFDEVAVQNNFWEVKTPFKKVVAGLEKAMYAVPDEVADAETQKAARDFGVQSIGPTDATLVECGFCGKPIDTEIFQKYNGICLACHTVGREV
jgi:hypothetical protein